MPGKKNYFVILDCNFSRKRRRIAEENRTKAQGRVVDVTSFGDQAIIGARQSLREGRRGWWVKPVDAYLLYVNQQQVPDVFETEAKVAAKPSIQNQATLQIKRTWGVRNWNYKYDLNQWLELSPRG